MLEPTCARSQVLLALQHALRLYVRPWQMIYISEKSFSDANGEKISFVKCRSVTQMLHLYLQISVYTCGRGVEQEKSFPLIFVKRDS